MSVTIDPPKWLDLPNTKIMDFILEDPEAEKRPSRRKSRIIPVWVNTSLPVPPDGSFGCAQKPIPTHSYGE